VWIFAIGIVMASVAAGVLLLAGRDERIARSQAPEQRGAGTTTAGIVRFTGERSCRELEIDNRTGRLSAERQVNDCTEKRRSTDPNDIMKERYSSGRLNSIRDSFSGR